jgi:hypothetical protein
VKRISILAMFLAAVTTFSTSCGQSDYLQSVQLSAQGATAGGSYNLPGVDATLQLQVMAVYHSGKQVDVTNNVTWTVTVAPAPSNVDMNGVPLPPYGPDTVPISPNGLMQAVEDVCTWVDGYTTTSGKTTYDNPAVWAYTGYYQVVASYRQFTSNPIGVGVGSEDNPNSPGGCGPTNSTTN